MNRKITGAIFVFHNLVRLQTNDPKREPATCSHNTTSNGTSNWNSIKSSHNARKHSTYTKIIPIHIKELKQNFAMNSALIV